MKRQNPEIMTLEEFRRQTAKPARKTYDQAEQRLQAALVAYVAKNYPNALYKGDPFNGLISLPIQLAVKAKKMGNRKSWPDFHIADPRRGYAGLYLELKREGTTILRQDGELVSDEHIREQHAMLEELGKRGHYARFVVGFAQAKETVDWYLGESD